MVLYRPLCTAKAIRLGRYPSLSATSLTFFLVASEAQQLERWLRIMEAVFVATPEALATSTKRGR